MLVVGGRNAGGRGEALRGFGLGELPGALDAELDVADGREILIKLALVAAAELAVEVVEVGLDHVQHAFALGIPFGRSAAEPAPKSRSKTSLGLTSLGSGCVAERQDIVEE